MLLLNIKVESFGYVLSHTYRVIHTSDNYVSCVAGSFPAIEIRYTIIYPLLSTEYISHYYYSANIGLILREDAPDLSGNTKVYSLMRWGGE